MLKHHPLPIFSIQLSDFFGLPPIINRFFHLMYKCALNLNGTNIQMTQYPYYWGT